MVGGRQDEVTKRFLRVSGGGTVVQEVIKLIAEY